MAAEIVASGAEAMAPSLRAVEAEEKKMVMLRSKDGVEFVLSEAEERQCGRTVDDFRIPSGSDGGGGETSYSPIHLSVQGDTLSRVIQYSKLHNASGSQGLSDWDAEFIAGFDHDTLFDLIIAAKYLGNRGLLDLTCRTIAHMIKGKSFDEIRAMFNIRTNLNKNTSDVKEVDTLDWRLTATPAESSAAHDDPVLTLQQKQNAVKALHIVRCQDFTAYDPQRNDFVCTRFCSYNIAFFDLDKESKIARGPPLERMLEPVSRYGVEYSLNVISLKVTESLAGDDLCVFGTVLARDEVDYRCLCLFRREMDDAQAITLPDGMLTLTDPCRGLVMLNKIYFEIDLKIKCDGGKIKDLSRGVISFEKTRLPGGDRKNMTLGLTSWLSKVELACAYVYQPVEANIAINILKGPCNIRRVAALIPGNNIILYDSEADGTTGDGVSCSVPLTRRVVLVPFKKKLVLHLVGYDTIKHVCVTLRQSVEESVCKMGLGKVQVKVAWTVIPKRRDYELEVIGNQRLLH